MDGVTFGPEHVRVEAIVPAGTSNPALESVVVGDVHFALGAFHRYDVFPGEIFGCFELGHVSLSLSSL